MDLATDIYIQRVNGSPCGDSVVHLFKGANSSSKQHLRQQVLTYLKSSQKCQSELMEENPVVYGFIKEVWAV